MSRRSRRLDVTDLKELVSKNLLLGTGATLVVTGALLLGLWVFEPKVPTQPFPKPALPSMPTSPRRC